MYLLHEAVKFFIFNLASVSEFVLGGLISSKFKVRAPVATPIVTVEVVFEDGLCIFFIISNRNRIYS